MKSSVLILLCVLLLAACQSAPPPKRSAARARVPVTTAPQPAPPSRADGDQVTVAKGDTVYSIAFRNQVDYHDLADWNGIGRDYAIRVGQVLRLTPPVREGLPLDRGSAVAVSIPAPATPSSSPVATPAVRGDTAVTSPAAPSTAPAAVPRPSASRPASIAAHGDDGSWEWPTRGRVVRRFGADPSAKGIDITGDRGQIVIASRAGKVVYSGTALKGYGELIIVKHDEQFLSAYGYNRRRLVNEGDTVSAGQPIAEVGDGPEQRPLLHFEVREKGRPVDPLQLLPKR